MHPLLDKVRKEFESNEIRCAGMVVAISGGPDSVALARAMLEVQPGGHEARFILAHFNHLLRGAASDADESFVRQLTDRLATAGFRVEFRGTREDIAAAARNERANLEAMGRKRRYGWLAEVARAEGTAFVATAHTANDQAETVFHRIVRGTGIRGLRGIARRRLLQPGVEVIRPMIAVTRHEVLDYLTKLAQEYRIDATNEDTTHTRARIRHKILPFLERTIDGSVIDHFCRLADQAAQRYQMDECKARALLAAAERPSAGAIRILSRQILSEAPESLAREALRMLWLREGWPLRDMSAYHWKQLAGACRAGGAINHVPGGIDARVRRAVLQLGPRNTQSAI